METSHMSSFKKIGIKECRRILKENGYERELTDEEIQQLRDFLYQLAEIQIEAENKQIDKR